MGCPFPSSQYVLCFLTMFEQPGPHPRVISHGDRTLHPAPRLLQLWLSCPPGCWYSQVKFPFRFTSSSSIGSYKLLLPPLEATKHRVPAASFNPSCQRSRVQDTCKRVHQSQLQRWCPLALWYLAHLILHLKEFFHIFFLFCLSAKDETCTTSCEPRPLWWQKDTR
jgi:hypothetical protein